MLSRPAICRSSLREPRAVLWWMTCCIGNDSSRGVVRLSDLAKEKLELSARNAQVALSRPAMCRASLHGLVMSLSLSQLAFYMRNDSSRIKT